LEVGAKQDLVTSADAALRVPVLVVSALQFDRADAATKIKVPNLGGQALLLVADALAKLGIPVEPSDAFLRLALTRAGGFVPIVSRCTHLGPFAGAFAILPIPVLVVKTVLLLDAPALASH
jgi:hypothetical protein